jgi:4-hydroxybenzoyl-CoA thioesterase
MSVIDASYLFRQKYPSSGRIGIDPPQRTAVSIAGQAAGLLHWRRRRTGFARRRAPGTIAMKEEPFVPPPGAFTRTVAIRFSHCDPAGIVYFPNYFDMFNGLIEDWYTEQLGVDYSNLILNEHFGFPFVHIETDFKLPSRMGEHLDLTLLLTRIGRSSLSVVIVGHLAGIERLRARLVTAMMSLETQHAIELPPALRAKFEAYLKRTGAAQG